MKQKTACNIMIVLLIVVLLFHISILVGLIDFKNVWGGRLTNRNEMYVFETVSIILNTFLLSLIIQKVGYIKQFLPIKIINTTLWIFVFIFGLNTIGNLFASNLLEKILGTILTITSAYLCRTIVRKK